MAPHVPPAAALTRQQSRQLSREENTQVRQLQAQQRRGLHDLRTAGHPDANAVRDLRARNAQQIRDLHQQFHDRRMGLTRPPPSEAGASRPDGRPRITPQAARDGRFGFRFHDHDRGRWRADRIAPRLAWRGHHHAGFVAWHGGVFLPYAATDLFYYPFWPDAYDDSYWPDAYDNLLDSVYWASGNPYSSSPYAAPAAAAAVADPGAPVDCGSDLTAWPFDRIAKVVRPTPEQQAGLDGLKAAAAQAADALKAACPQAAQLTPTGRLDAMLARLQGTAGAVRAVHAPLLTFYDSLTDEQKARFNALGPQTGRKAAAGPSTDQATDGCSGQKPGLTDLPIENLEDALHPTDVQLPLLSQLRNANDQAIAALQAACPDTVPQTPPGRLEAIEKRLDAMIAAAQAIKPALQQFYAALTDEQKSQFNTLGQAPGQQTRG